MSKVKQLQEIFKAMNVNEERGLQRDEVEIATRNNEIAEKLISSGDLNGNGSLDNTNELETAITECGFDKDNPLSIYVKDKKTSHRALFNNAKVIGRKAFSIFSDSGKIEIKEGLIYKKSDKLIINTSSQEHYYVDMNQQDGEEQLHQLASNPNIKQEESWFFISGIDRSTGARVERWFEYGEGTGDGVIYNNNAILMDVLAKYKIQKLSTYHIHPLGMSIDEGPESCNCLEFPSYNDHQSVIMQAMDLYDLGMRNIQYDDRIITPRGKIIMTPNTLELIKLDRKEHDAFNFIVMEHMSDTIPHLGFCRTTNPMTFIPTLSSQYLNINYQSWE